MKKTLLALAAIAASSAAFAQSSVSLYGVVDASVESIKGNDTTVSRVSSDNLATSRLGFKGTEDLGGGLKAKFVLETALKSDTGAQGNSARFFERAAWAGLAGGFGELRLGRQDSSAGLLAGNTSLLGAQAYDDLKIAKTYAGDGYRRLDNAVTYLLPTLVKGLSAQVQYSTAAGTSGATGTEAYGNDQGKTWGFNVAYAADGVVAGVGYVNGKFNPAGSVKDTGVLAYAGYDFAVAKLTGYYNMDKQTDAAEIRRLIGVRLDVPVSKEFAVQASVSKVKNTTLATRGDDDNATIVAMKGVYSLSKRTAVYGLFTNVNNSDNANLVVSGATAGFGKTSRGLAVGVSHQF
ncbi:porin [uncultured Aquabacterium sp.]|uniref:porin n=1 Tax=Aquabacterium sp. TaxID=1872578 RepID=UPI0025DA87BC|nr:porin [uncultured Aquabacterium sp.]